MKVKEEKVIHSGSGYDAAAERAENVLGARIAAARKLRGWNLNALAESLSRHGVEISRGAVSKWETGETVPNAYQFLAVCAALGMDRDMDSYRENHSPELNEEGLKKVAEYRRDLISSGNYRPAPKAADLMRFREVPVAYIPAAAGTGNFLDEADLFEKVSFPEDKVPRGADVGIRVSGDSMEPVYHDGQIVFVQKCSALNPGEVGIFEYDGKAYIKLYREREPEEEFLEEFTDSYGTVHPQPLLVSYNGKYDPIEVNPYSTFRVLGRVLK